MARFEHDEKVEEKAKGNCCAADGCPITPTFLGQQNYCRYHYGRPMKFWNQITNRLRRHENMVKAYHLLISNSEINWTCGKLKDRLKDHIEILADETYMDCRARVKIEVEKKLFDYQEKPNVSDNPSLSN